MQIPITTLLAVTILGERLTKTQWSGMALTLAGVVVVMWNPVDMRASAGLLYVVGSSLAAAIGAIMLKRVERIKPLQLQAWSGVTALLPISLLSLSLEHDQLATASQLGWIFVGGVMFSALVAAIFAHTTYYAVLRRNGAAMLAPLLTLSPILTILFGALITHDQMVLRQMAGSAVVLAGCLIVVMPRRGPAAQPVPAEPSL